LTSNDDERKAILDDLAGCDLPTLRRLAELLNRRRRGATNDKSSYLDFLRAVADSDVSFLKEAEKSYGNSWKLRGGINAFYLLRQKWERMEEQLAKAIDPSGANPGADPYDIFEHILSDNRANGIIDDVRDLRRYLFLIEAEINARKLSGILDSGRSYLDQLQSVATSDIEAIKEKEKDYGASWKRSGGIGAFMTLARKWDRIKQRVTTRIDHPNGALEVARDDIFQHINADRRAEGAIDNIRDLRRYLLLVEAEMAARRVLKIGAPETA
jgi:hypothetical protein